jgi:hypothetical protein
VTITHMGGRNSRKRMQMSYLDYIESFGWEELWKVHDVLLCFEVEQLYQKILTTGKYPIYKQSKDIEFLKVPLKGGLEVRVIVHRTGTINCHLKCTQHPIEVTPEGLTYVSAMLGKVCLLLEQAAESSSFVYKQSVVPNVPSWVVNQWHFGKDGKKEISGKSYNTTYRDWTGALVRIYLKKHGKKFKARKEVIEQPRKPLPDAFSEKIESNETKQTKSTKEES